MLGRFKWGYISRLEFLSEQSHLSLSGSKQSQCKGEFIAEEINTGGGSRLYDGRQQLGKGRLVQIIGDLGLAL